MVDEYALKEAFNKIKDDIENLKKEIIMLKEKLNEPAYEDQTEELLEMSNIEKQPVQDEINITDSYY